MKTISAHSILSIGLLLSTPALAASAATSHHFFWGVANAAFQVEGTPQDSDWKRWTHQSQKISDGANADQATRFWNRYDEDFSWAQKLGANAFRISLAWERIEPARGNWNEEALRHYETMIQSLRAHGLEPIVTLHHFVLPVWLSEKGGLRSPEFVEAFTEYAEKVMTRFSQKPAQVQYWMTFNEPAVLTHAGYLAGEWPPGHQGDAQGTVEAMAQIARAHIAAVGKMRALQNPQLKVSIAKHWRVFESKGGPLGWVAAKITDWIFNRQIMTALMTGKLTFWMPGSSLIREKIELPEHRPTLDYLGLNYYGRSLMSFSLKAPFVLAEEGPGPKTDVDWEMYPEGLYRALQQTRRYHLPVIISENGLADAQDRWRSDFLKSHLEKLNQARQEGIPVVGYLHWSLTDNFEWAKGLTPRFGLIEIDYATGKRTPRPSFETYRALIRAASEKAP